MVGLVEDAAAFLDVVAVEPDDERLGRLVAEDLERALDAVGDLVTGGDAAEDVDEHAPDLLVVDDHVEAVGHDLGVGAAADVEEVRRLHATVRLPGVRDHVERRHDQARAVADDADRAVELDVVEALVLGLGLERVGLVLDLERLVVGVADLGGVVVERHLAVERLELVAGQPRERVDLDQRRVLLDEDRVELLDHRDGLLEDRLGELGLGRDLAGLGRVDAGARVDGDLLDRVGVGLGDLLDLHAALDGGDAEVLPVGPVEQEGEVVLLLGRRRRGDEHPVDGQALDLHPEDVGRVLERLVGRLGQLDAAGLAAAAGLDLRLDDAEAVAPRRRPAPPRAWSTTVPRVVTTPCLAKSSFAWYSIKSTASAPVLETVCASGFPGTLVPVAGPDESSPGDVTQATSHNRGGWLSFHNSRGHPISGPVVNPLWSGFACPSPDAFARGLSVGHHRADVPSPARAGSGTPNTPGRRAANVPVDSPSTTTTLQVADIQAEAARHAYVGKRRAPVPASSEVEIAPGRDRQRRQRRPGARLAGARRPDDVLRDRGHRPAHDRPVPPGARAGDVEHHHDLRQRPARRARQAPRGQARRLPRPAVQGDALGPGAPGRRGPRDQHRRRAHGQRPGSRPARRAAAPTHASALSGSSGIGTGGRW